MASEKKLSIARRHKRIRKKIFGTQQIPRLFIGKTNKNISVQFIDDASGKTLLGVSSQSLKLKNAANVKAAVALGKLAGEQALAKGMKQVVFDRGGYLYHGKIKAFADAARAAGLKF
jgi:large subunit ribosomal protein L18